MEQLLEVQDSIKSQICKSIVNFKKSPKDRINKSYIESRLENLERQWDLFNESHNQIIREIKRSELQKSDYYKEDVYEQTEEIYIEYKTDLKEHLAKFNVMSKQLVSEVNPSRAQTFSVKLPKITIPTFSGKYTEWNSFRDLFVSLIHNNTLLDDVQKLHYLKSHLVGEAEQLLRHIPVTSDNYVSCWTQLERRYNNKRFLANCILKRLLSQKSLSSESANQIKDLIDTTTECLNALKNIGIQINTWDIIIIHIICLKLDTETRKQWELKISADNSDNLPTFKQFSEFLTSRFRALEFLDPKSSRVNSKGAQSFHVSEDRLYASCKFCSGDHKIAFCKNFTSEDCDTRRNFVQEHGICFICLGQNHLARSCNSSVRCKICKRRHHSLLHPKGGSVSTGAGTSSGNGGNVSTMVGIECAENKLPYNDYPDSDTEETTKPLVSCFSTEKSKNTVLLATALVEAESSNKSYHTVRALVDQGSQASFITEATTQYLGLKKMPSRQIIKGVGGDKMLTSKSTVFINLKSRIDPRFEIQVKAYVLRSITTLLPVVKIAAEKWVDIKEECLADPEYYSPNQINLLLGAEVYSQIIQEGIKKNCEGSMVAQYTTFGWIISGIASTSTEVLSNLVVMHVKLDNDELLKKFWELEAEPSSQPKFMSKEETLCEEYFTKTTKRDEEGRFVVRLPLRDNDPACKYGNSREIAEKRFKGLESRFNKNREFKREYTDVIKEYLDLGHLKQVPAEDDKKEIAVYLPHHAVIRKDKDTTKLRVVFDASCKGKNGVSLNDSLMIGPTLQAELRHLLLRWRKHQVCMVGDIVKMYRQVKVDEQDTMYQRILWREDPETKLNDYELKTVTFGTASAPYLAVRSLQQLAYDEGDNYPLAAKRVLTEFYMDDLMTGAETVEENINIFREMNDLLSKGGFRLQKWSSNSNELLKQINEKQIKQENTEEGLLFKLDSVMKILGLTWDRCNDAFQYTVNLQPVDEPVTKRKIISDIAKLFDPLGWVAPCIVVAKIIIQKLWLDGTDWDQEVSKNILDQWITYRNELPLLTKMHIPRWFNLKNSDVKVELHGFSDASKLAYSAVIYIRVIDAKNKIHVKLVTAKTKVAPIKQICIPRLELCGAVLVAKILVEVAEVINIPKNNIHAWTDSMIVLAWLNSHPNRWKTFVANRVSEIQTILESTHWAYVKSNDNPADCASRGLKPSELLQNEMWLHGPKFLKNPIIQFKKPKNNDTKLEELKPLEVFCTVEDETLWKKFSSLTKLTRVIAYCRRFLNLVRNRKNIKYCRENYLKSSELNEALEICIKHSQKEAFHCEIRELEQYKQLVSKRSNLKSLTPFLDANGILRVGGRLEFSNLPQDTKHPIIIPKESFLTQLLIKDAHLRTLHGGPQLMLRYLQSKYWIIGSNVLIKAHVRKCITCVRYRASQSHQLMGQLPMARVTPSKPFRKSGIDYAGPVNVRASKGRGYHAYKGYIALFVCMATKAVHLEAVSDLTTEGFLSAFKRFIARRGHCSDLWSDNGKNFVGAARELGVLFNSERSSMSNEIADYLATNGTTWHFIPPHSPNFGGLWESGIKSTKHHLKRVIGDSTLTYEELSTLLAQIEACLNSRPLYRTGSDSTEFVLTPGHFLITEPLVTAPDYNFETSTISSLRRWQLTQRMLQDFWRCWSREYLNKFLQRNKWTCQVSEPSVGDIVLVKEDDLPPSRWLMGKIIKKHPGSDNITRVVSLKTKTSVIKRPTSKLCILPID